MTNKFNLKNLVYAAFLAAISVVLTRFFSIMLSESLRIGIGEIPLMISGILFGPAIGALTGLVADFVGVMINPQGAFFLGFTLSSIFSGLIPGIIFKYLNLKSNILILISTIIECFFVHMILNSLWLSMMYGTSFIVLSASRTLKEIIRGVITFVILEIYYRKIHEKLKTLINK
ncbi:MAG: folate family ECF transporter S component [Peptoniphilaceae bacterium]|nr:folate family ECF transporter S component [Peptoniphilaceae bacterium]